MRKAILFTVAWVLLLAPPGAMARRYWVPQEYSVGIEGGAYIPSGGQSHLYGSSAMIGLKLSATEFEVEFQYTDLQSPYIEDANRRGFAIPDPDMWLLGISAFHNFNPVLKMGIGIEGVIQGVDYVDKVQNETIVLRDDPELAVTLGADLQLPLGDKLFFAVAPKYHYVFEYEDSFLTLGLGIRFGLS